MSLPLNWGDMDQIKSQIITVISAFTYKNSFRWNHCTDPFIYFLHLIMTQECRLYLTRFLDFSSLGRAGNMVNYKIRS